MCEGQRYMYTLLSNTSALLKQSLQDTNWVGYYLMQDGKLILGPFQGLVACEVIEVGKGVCGTAVERRETILVRNVHEFAGHIACDSASNSEIVIPIIINEQISFFFGKYSFDVHLTFTIQNYPFYKEKGDMTCQLKQRKS